MTAQEIFDKVAEHLLTQKVESRAVYKGYVNRACAYRGENRTKCAVGILIPDEDYRPEMEGNVPHKNLFSVEVWPNQDSAKPLKEHISLLSSLQRVHDNHHVFKWKEGLAEVAKEYNLDLAVLEKFT